MKKLIYLLFLTPFLLLISCSSDSDNLSPVNPQTLVSWEKTYGGNDWESGYSVQQTTDGGYIVTGRKIITTENSDVYLLKTDVNGIEQWTKTFGGISYDVGNSVQQTTDGGYIITGYTYTSATTSAVYLLKTDVNGIKQWTKTFGGGIGYDVGNSVQQTTDGGYIITGWTYTDENEYYPSVYLIKIDVNGVEQWTKNFGGTGNGWGYSIQQTTDGGYIITGGREIDLSGINYGVYLIKTDENGDSLWTNIYLGPGEISIGRSIQQTTDGGYVISGETSDFEHPTDIYLLKTDGNGIEQWNKTFGNINAGGLGLGNDVGYSVKQTNDGGYIVTGSTEATGDCYLLKTDGNGIEQWTKTFGGIGYHAEGHSVQQTNDGGYIITGMLSDAEWGHMSGNGDVYLIKTDGQGNVISN